MMTEQSKSASRVHKWTGYGTLCSLDNSREQDHRSTTDDTKVTCAYCHHLMIIERRGEGRSDE